MKRRNKSFHDYRGFIGPDINIETSLREYGLIWQLRKKKMQEYIFIYGINGKEIRGDGFLYDRFTYCYMSKKDWKSIVLESWFNAEGRICTSCDCSLQGFINGFPYTVQDAVLYHGAENIFGTSYYGGFTIGGEIC